MLYRSVTVHVARCACGLMPLNSHTTSDDAYAMVVAHHELNPTKCKPWITRERVDVPVSADADA